MASAVIGQAALVTARFQQTADGELFQWGVKTMRRDPADRVALMNALHTQITGGLLGLFGASKCTGITYSEWEATDFTGFHQKAGVTFNDTLGGGTTAPPQNCVVVSLLNTTTDQPIRRRRGRIYFGTLASSVIGTDGKVTAGNITAIRNAFVALNTAWAAIPVGVGTDGTIPDIGIVSAAAGLILSADLIGVGAAVDTQRRRRRQVPEAISYVTV